MPIRNLRRLFLLVVFVVGRCSRRLAALEYRDANLAGRELITVRSFAVTGITIRFEGVACLPSTTRCPGRNRFSGAVYASRIDVGICSKTCGRLGRERVVGDFWRAVFVKSHVWLAPLLESQLQLFSKRVPGQDHRPDSLESFRHYIGLNAEFSRACCPATQDGLHCCQIGGTRNGGPELAIADGVGFSHFVFVRQFGRCQYRGLIDFSRRGSRSHRFDRDVHRID